MAFALKGNSCRYSISFYSFLCFFLKKNTDHPTVWILHFCFIIVVTLERGYTFCVFRKTVRTMSTLLSCFVCVYWKHLSNTGGLSFQGLRCLRFHLKLSQASFLSPRLTLVTTGEPLLAVVLLDSLKWYLSSHSFQPCLLGPPKNGGVRGEPPPGVVVCGGRCEFTEIRPNPTSAFSTAS